MISDVTLVAEVRTSRGSNEARRMRRAGKIPVSVYSKGTDAAALAVNAREIAALLRSEETRHAIFNLDLAGEKTAVMVKSIQLHPLRGTLIHADLLRVDLAANITVNVPLHLVGEPVGVKTGGGSLEHGVREIQIACLPKDVPSHFDVDVKGLQVGQHIYASDVKLPEGLKLVSDGHQIVAVVQGPRGAAVESATPAAEPEVIKRGKPEAK